MPSAPACVCYVGYTTGMEFQDVVRRRRMVRNFDPDTPVDDATLDRILTNATRAPSAGFSQGWAFVVLRTPEERGLFWGDDLPTTGWLAGIAKAPVLVIVLSSKDVYLDRYAEPDKGWTDRDEARWPVPYWDVDAGMAALLMLLTATDAGLGAVFFGPFAPHWPHAARRLAIPDSHSAVGIVALGHRAPDEPSPSLRRGRRGLDEVVHWGRW